MSTLPFHEEAGRCQEILWLGKFICDVSFARYQVFLAGEAAVKTERSEFILSLDGGRSQA
jgi:hypothetical protein